MNSLLKGVLVAALSSLLSTCAYAGTQVDEQRAKVARNSPV